MKLKGEYPRGRPKSRWEQVRKDDILKEGRKDMKEIEEDELWKTVVFQAWRLLAYAPELSTNSSDSRDDVFVYSVFCYSKK